MESGWKQMNLKTKLIVLVLSVLIVAGAAYYAVTALSSPSSSCRNNQLVLGTHNLSGSQVFSTWYNCQDVAVKFVVVGKVWSKSTDQTNQVNTFSPVFIGPHQSTSVQSDFRTDDLNGIDQLTIYAVNASSPSQVLSQVYTFYPG